MLAALRIYSLTIKTLRQTDMSDPFALSDQTVLVTGGGGGIGSDISRQLARAGATVVVHYHQSAENAERVVDNILEDGNLALAVQANLSLEDETRALFEKLQKDGYVLDALVNNAARMDVCDLLDMSLEQWQAMNAANMDSAFLTTRLFAEQLIATESEATNGAIVNIASIEGLDPAQGHSHYAASKAAMLMFTKATALELGPKGIRANAVSPGLIQREGIRDQWPEGVASWEAKAPTGCMGSTMDIAYAVQYLLSPAAAWVAGENLVVDGGMSATSHW